MKDFMDLVAPLRTEDEFILADLIYKYEEEINMPVLTNYQKALQKREREEMAKRMLDKGMDTKTIAEVTKLSEDEIKEVANRPTKEAA
jgi:transposase-like protein